MFYHHYDANVIQQKAEIASQFSLRYLTEPLVTFTDQGIQVVISFSQLVSSNGTSGAISSITINGGVKPPFDPPPVVKPAPPDPKEGIPVKS